MSLQRQAAALAVGLLAAGGASAADQRISGSQLGEVREVTVGGPQLRDAVTDADCGNPSVMELWPRDATGPE